MQGELPYKMEELFPLVSELAERYMGFESTSVTYERAQQLMEAVLYCIRTYETAGSAGGTSSNGALHHAARRPVREAYALGYRLVLARVEALRQLYHEILAQFDAYGNRCLADTFQRGLPEFFKWYDARYCPQNTILTLDYPVLGGLQGDCGVDAVLRFARGIRLEQLFLQGMPRDTVIGVLRQVSPEYGELVENLAELVLTEMLKQVETGTGSEQQNREAVQQMMTTRYRNLSKADRDQLVQYLQPAVTDITVRLLHTGAAAKTTT